MLWRFIKKLEIKPPYDPGIPLLGIYPEEIKAEKDTCILLFIAALSMTLCCVVLVAQLCLTLCDTKAT